MNSNDDNDPTGLIQYQDSQGRWYELFSPTEVLVGQEAIAHQQQQWQLPPEEHAELQIGNFHLSSTQLFNDLQSADQVKEQCQPHGASPPLRQQQRKKKGRGNRRQQHIRRRARRQNSDKSQIEANHDADDDVDMDDEQVQVSRNG